MDKRSEHPSPQPGSSNRQSEESRKGKIGKGVEIADKLSLGISVVVAILIGVGVGIWLKNLFNSPYLFWLGVAWGVGAAILNIVRALKRLKREWEEEAKRHKIYKLDRDEDEEEKWG
jgi:F0F1-type ATP synthase assembly protein I